MLMAMGMVIPVRLVTLTPTSPGIIIMMILITCVHLRHLPGDWREPELCLGNKAIDMDIEHRAQREVS